MEEFINQVKQIVPMESWIYIAAVLAALVILAMIMMGMRKRKAKRMLDECETHYNTLKAVPLAFKLNKAGALARVNKTMQETVENAQQEFDGISEDLKECSLNLAKCDDMIYSHKVKQSIKGLNELKGSLQKVEIRVNAVNGILDGLLEQENEQRVAINALKDEFRELRKRIAANRSSYAGTYEFMEHEIVKIETMFSTFEDLMFASDFTRAWEQQKDIKDKMNSLNHLCDILPGLYERARGILPHNMEEVGYAYAQARNKGIYLDHLQVHSNLDVVSDLLKEILKRLRSGAMEGVDEDLKTCETRVEQLGEQIAAEDSAFNEIRDNLEILFDMVGLINNDVEGIHSLYNRVYERFGFENWSVRLKETDEKLVVLNDMKRKMEKSVQADDIPSTTLLIAYKELEQSTTLFHNDVDDMKQRLHAACSDEERAKKQLVKLQLILNEIRVKMRRHRLPNVSTQFEDDLRKGSMKVREIETLLNNTPLDVKVLNFELRQTIDYVYTLYNSVNNLVGMASMVENAIVFGNRYRSSYTDIDSELTRADLCFRNGEYTKALKIAIQCIEKIHPGSYEKLLLGKEGVNAEGTV